MLHEKLKHNIRFKLLLISNLTYTNQLLLHNYIVYTKKATNE